MKKDIRLLGFTLLEILVALFVLGILLVSFLWIFTSTLRESNTISAKNTLIAEGQTAIQMIASRVQEACYLYPAGQTANIGSGATRPNTLNGGTWSVSNRYIAMILPPEKNQTQYRAFAYLPIARNDYNAINPNTALPAKRNDANTWVLMEYRHNLPSKPATGETCAAWVARSNPSLAGGNSVLLADGIQPDDAPYRLFDASANNLTMHLKMLGTSNGADVTISANDDLRLSAAPRNLNIEAR